VGNKSLTRADAEATVIKWICSVYAVSDGFLPSLPKSIHFTQLAMPRSPSPEKLIPGSAPSRSIPHALEKVDSPALLPFPATQD